MLSYPSTVVSLPVTAVPLRGMADSLHTAIRALRVLRRRMVQTLHHALTRRQRVHPSTHPRRAPRPSSAYTMLVESDVLGGMRGVLP
jgi:hypothetical protein